MGKLLSQFFPPSQTFTEKDVPYLAGKVFIVTGGNSGVGFELVKILYAKGGMVYIASRSPNKVENAINEIKTLHAVTKGKLNGLHLDLSDLSTISMSVSSFLAQESCLDVLFNNAGISQDPNHTISKQGHEIIMATDCLGHFLLTELLLPTLLLAAKSSPQASVRVVYTSSGIIVNAAPPASKAGCWMLAAELDKRTRKNGLVCVCQSPGTLKTKGWDRASPMLKLLMKPVMYEPKMGAYTELWAGLSPEVKLEDDGTLGLPWGRWNTEPKKDISESMKTEKEGGMTLSASFYAWCEENTRGFAQPSKHYG